MGNRPETGGETGRIGATWALLVSGALLVGLPLLGVLFSGGDLGMYLEFPPVTRHVRHAAFAWPVFVALALLEGAFVAACGWLLWRGRGAAAAPRKKRPFPWWGRAAVAANLAVWVLAWTRFDWMGALQRHTFSGLWLTYIVIVNAWTWKRSGRCMLLDRPILFGLLFPVSALFWWFFEFLNRFVQNWYYVQTGGLTAGDYVLAATLPFATVLPAVGGTFELLRTYPRLSAGMRSLPPLRGRRPRLWSALVLLPAAAALAGIALWPDVLFPVLWISPVVILLCVRRLLGCRPAFPGPARGDWRSAWLAALAALVCGVFWELWNAGSYAGWEYAIPYVGRFHVFEMPILGYGGYIPFGLECFVLTHLVATLLGRPWPAPEP